MQGRLHGNPISLSTFVKSMSKLTRLVCQGCSSLSPNPLAGLSALKGLTVCHLSNMPGVCDETCRELATLPKVSSMAQPAAQPVCKCRPETTHDARAEEVVPCTFMGSALLLHHMP